MSKNCDDIKFINLSHDVLFYDMSCRYNNNLVPNKLYPLFDNINIKKSKFDDMIFNDMYVYQNDIDYGYNKCAQLGIDKCYKNKSGTCVKYGHTGIGYYYLPKKYECYYGELLNLDLTRKERNQSITDNLIFPNLR